MFVTQSWNVGEGEGISNGPKESSSGFVSRMCSQQRLMHDPFGGRSYRRLNSDPRQIESVASGWTII